MNKNKNRKNKKDKNKKKEQEQELDDDDGDDDDDDDDDGDWWRSMKVTTLATESSAFTTTAEWNSQRTTRTTIFTLPTTARQAEVVLGGTTRAFGRVSCAKSTRTNGGLMTLSSTAEWWLNHSRQGCRSCTGWGPDPLENMQEGSEYVLTRPPKISHCFIQKLLLDNSSIFTSSRTKRLVSKWKVKLVM